MLQITQHIPAPWPPNTPLISLQLHLQPQTHLTLDPHHSKRLHAWFLDQIRQTNPHLSQQLHDSGSTKPFRLSRLPSPTLQPDRTYPLHLTTLNPRTSNWLRHWYSHPPTHLTLNNNPLRITAIDHRHPPRTYTDLWHLGHTSPPQLHLHFTSPTAFRRKGHHLPLPWPRNLLQSYATVWNHFADTPHDLDPFLTWVDEHILIQSHQIQTHKVAAGKEGSFTGFTGHVSLTVSRTGQQDPHHYQWYRALGHLASYSGTGHKTPFGLGQTDRHSQSHLSNPPTLPKPAPQPVSPSSLATTSLTDRIQQLQTLFYQQRHRQGGTRAAHTAQLWATILARREQGHSLQSIAQDLNLKYETAKTYSKLARKALQTQPRNSTPDCPPLSPPICPTT